MIIDVTNLIKAEIAESGSNLREIARNVGISPATLSRLQNKKFRPNVDHIATLSKWLQISVEDIVNFYTIKK